MKKVTLNDVKFGDLMAKNIVSAVKSGNNHLIHGLMEVVNQIQDERERHALQAVYQYACNPPQRRVLPGEGAGLGDQYYPSNAEMRKVEEAWKAKKRY